LPFPKKEVAAFPMPKAVFVLLFPVESTVTPGISRELKSRPVDEAVLLRPIAVFLLPLPPAINVAALPIPIAVETFPVPYMAEAELLRPIANAPLPELASAVLPGNREIAHEPCPVAEQLPSPIDPRPPTDMQAALAVPEEKPQKADASAPVASAPTTTVLDWALALGCALCLPAELTRCVRFRCLDPRRVDAT
jgi:hypothetical protein